MAIVELFAMAVISQTGRVPAPAVGVLYVTKGDVQLIAGTARTKAKAIERLREAVVLDFRAGATGTVLLSSTGERFSVSGPARLRVSAKAIATLSGAKPVAVRRLTGTSARRIADADEVIGAVVSRADATLKPTGFVRPGDKLSWEPQLSATEVEFQVFLPGQARSLLTVRLPGDAGEWTLPASLQPSTPYRLVFKQTQDGETVASEEAMIFIGSPEERKLLAEMRAAAMTAGPTQLIDALDFARLADALLAYDLAFEGWKRVRDLSPAFQSVANARIKALESLAPRANF